MSKLRVLVGCERSGRVRDAFRARGHDAWSCDLEPSDAGPFAQYHRQQDVLTLLDEGWDLLVGHPVCTYLCRTSEQWLYKQPGRYDKMLAAVDFFLKLYNAPIEKICLENPQPGSAAAKLIGIPYTQAIHPNYFGDPTTKRTCLWLKKLPPLVWQNDTDLLGEKTTVDVEYVYAKKSGRKWTKWFWESSMIPAGPERSRFRSDTFPGIARQMAAQWG